MNTSTRETYRAVRAQRPSLSASWAMHITRARERTAADPAPDWVPSSPWDHEHEHEHEGLTYKFTAGPDESATIEDAGLGKFGPFFSGSYRPDLCVGYVQDLTDGYVSHSKREGRGSARDYSGWKGDMSAEDYAKSYHEEGMSKGEARERGIKDLLSDYQRAVRISEGQEHIYSLGVTVHNPKGEELGAAYLGCVTFGGTAEEDDAYCRETFWELAQEAAHEAQGALTAEAAEAARLARRESAWG